MRINSWSSHFLFNFGKFNLQVTLSRSLCSFLQCESPFTYSIIFWKNSVYIWIIIVLTHIIILVIDPRSITFTRRNQQKGINQFHTWLLSLVLCFGYIMHFWNPTCPYSLQLTPLVCSLRPSTLVSTFSTHQRKPGYVF